MHEDSSVSEIIGAVLLFVIVISLITMYMTWYVPLSDRNAQQEYYELESSSFSMISSDMVNLNSFSEKVPMGIHGPIGNQYSTSLVFTNDTFDASLFFNVTVETDNGSGTFNNTIHGKFMAFGSIVAFASTSFLSREEFKIADGVVSINDLFNSFIPLSIANHSVSFYMVNLSGQSGAVSSYSSGDIQGYSSYTSLISEAVNNTVTGISSSGKVIKITLDSANYSIYQEIPSSFFDYIYMFSNSSRIPPPSCFSMLGFNISRNISSVSFRTLTPLNLTSFSMLYRDINIEEN
ncbi:MAG: hypothetical protein ACP5UV_02710 [Thermoplasmata archaeon]